MDEPDEVSPGRTGWKAMQVADRSWLESQNAKADEWTRYTLLYIARHGEGYHNQVSEAFERDAGLTHVLTNRLSRFTAGRPGTAIGPSCTQTATSPG